MDKLPQDLYVDILRRLDSADVARCRVASKIFDDAYSHLRSIKFKWTIVKPSSENLFKKNLVNLISNMRVVESLCIGVDELREYNKNLDVDFNENRVDLLNLVTNEDFIKEWLPPKVSENLKSLSVTDFLQEPLILWQESNVLHLVSTYCHKLVELKVKHAWLSLDSLNPMSMLTSLTLEALHLYDEHITELNMCVPNLQVLNLVSVNGLTNPKIHLLNLKSGYLTSHINLQSLSIIAPKLIRLRLKGICASNLYVEAPMLSHFHIDHYYVQDAFSLKKFENLKHLSIKSPRIHSTLYDLKTPIKTVENLTVDSRGFSSGFMSNCEFTLEKLLTVFPKVTSLCIKSSAWWELESSFDPDFSSKITDGTKGLKTLSAYLNISHLSVSFSCVACVLDQCIGLSEVSLLIRNDVDGYVLKTFVAKCVARWPRLKWRWGMYSEGMEDSFPCDQFEGLIIV